MSVYTFQEDLSSIISKAFFNRDFMECNCPNHDQEYSLLRKRLNYQPDNNYIKPEALFAALANFILMAEVQHQKDLETTSREKLLNSYTKNSARGLMWSLIESLEKKPNHIPIYKLSTGLVDKFLHTHLSEELILHQLKVPLPKALILLPTPERKNNYNLNWIYFEYHQCQCQNPHCRIGGIYCVSVLEGMVYFATRLILNDSPLRLDVNSWHATMPAIKKLKEIFNPNYNNLLFKPIEEYTNNLFAQWDNKIDIDDFCYFINYVVVNFLMFLQTYPQSIKVEQLKKKGFGKKSKSKYLVPTKTLVLPLAKKLNLSPTSIDHNFHSPENGVTPHWRCGHWRNQPFGSREHPQYRIQWIEPVWVNGMPTSQQSP